MPEVETPTAPSDAAQMDEALAFAAFAAEQGVALGDLALPPEEVEEEREPEPLPGASEDEVDVSDLDKHHLAVRLCERIDTYFSTAMARRREKEEEIRRAFNLIPDPGGAALGGETEVIVSGIMRRLTLQASSRLKAGILDADRIAKVRPIHGATSGPQEKDQLALDTENFLTNLLQHQVRISRRLGVALDDTTLVGTSVIRCGWKRTKRTKRFYDREAKLQEKTETTESLDWKVIPNERAIVWPPTIVDWQEDYEVVGYETTYSHSGWHAKASELGLSEQEAHEVYALPGESDEDRARRLGEQGIDFETLGTMGEELDPVTIAELWCNLPVPGMGMEPQRFVVILCRASQKILRINWNTHHEQWHPFFPIRWRIVPHSAWGEGVGDDIINKQAKGSALETLQIDNIAAGAYHVNQIVAGSLADQTFDRVRPGDNVYVSEIDTEFKPTSMGGAAQEVDMAKAANDFDASLDAGIPDVLQGVADRVMKSGQSTGATMALVEQASVRFGATGRTVKDDLSDLLSFSLQQVAQYAPNGLYYKYAPREVAESVQLLRYVPPRDAAITELFHIEVEAPSMAASNEARRERYLMVWQFSIQYLDWLQQNALPLLQQENPAAIPRLISQAVSFAHQVARRIIQHSDLPGLPEELPEIPEPMPADQQINQLMQQMQQMQVQLEQAMGENQQLKMQFAGAPQPTEGLPS
jgi:hypothetical protein